MRRISIALFIGLAFLSSCGKKAKSESEENAELRRIAHKAMCYRLSGDVDGYLRMTLDYERLPPEYRSQLHDMMLQHLADEQERLGRLTAASVVGDTLLSDDAAEVYVEMTWADSIKERVHLSLVRRDKQWWLK